MADGPARARIDGVGVAFAIEFVEVTVVAGGGHGLVTQRNDVGNLAHAFQRFLDTEAPCFPIGIVTVRPHFPSHFHHVAGDAGRLHSGSHLVDGKALCNRREVAITYRSGIF